LSKKPAVKKQQKAGQTVPVKDTTPAPPQLTREQLETLREKLMKRFH